MRVNVKENTDLEHILPTEKEALFFTDIEYEFVPVLCGLCKKT